MDRIREQSPLDNVPPPGSEHTDTLPNVSTQGVITLSNKGNNYLDVAQSFKVGTNDLLAVYSSIKEGSSHHAPNNAQNSFEELPFGQEDEEIDRCSFNNFTYRAQEHSFEDNVPYPDGRTGTLSDNHNFDPANVDHNKSHDLCDIVKRFEDQSVMLSGSLPGHSTINQAAQTPSEHSICFNKNYSMATYDPFPELQAMRLPHRPRALDGFVMDVTSNNCIQHELDPYAQMLVEQNFNGCSRYGGYSSNFQIQPYSRNAQKHGMSVPAEISHNAQQHPASNDTASHSITPDITVASTVHPKKRRAPVEEKRSYNVLLKEIPLYDYIIPGPHLINFTAVEIIALLPKWYHNYWVAHRFVSNGITWPIHRQILRAHRSFDQEKGEDFPRNTIGDRYRATMNGGGRKGRKAAEGKWLLATHKVPSGWDHGNISVNGFVPNRVWKNPGSPKPEPESVRFTDLLRGMSKLPEGDDAADLTRCIEFAEANIRPTVNIDFKEYMFPDHLQEIMQMIGQAQLTPAQTDGAVFARYLKNIEMEKLTGNGKQKDLHTALGKGGTMAVPAAKGLKNGLFVLHAPGVPTYAPPTGNLPMDPAEPHAPGLQPDPFPQYSAQIQPSFSFLRGLIRISPVPDDKDVGYTAQVIRFAQRPNQHLTDWLWDSIDDVATISGIITTEWTQQLNAKLDTPWNAQYPLWRDYTDKSNPIVNEILVFVSSITQLGVNWRICEEHARVLSRVDRGDEEMAEMSLEYFACTVRDYDVMVHADDSGLTDGFLDATRDVMMQLGLWGAHFSSINVNRQTGYGQEAQGAEIVLGESMAAVKVSPNSVSTPPLPPQPGQLLREYDIGPHDTSGLAAAARFAKRQEQIAIDWTVEDFPDIIERLDAEKGWEE